MIGYFSLVNPFMMAGAKRVCASVWEIPDISTSEFMYNFYRNKIQFGQNYCEALSNVKRAFIKGKFRKEWQHPKYWASYILFGN